MVETDVPANDATRSTTTTVALFIRSPLLVYSSSSSSARAARLLARAAFAADFAAARSDARLRSLLVGTVSAFFYYSMPILVSIVKLDVLFTLRVV